MDRCNRSDLFLTMLKKTSGNLMGFWKLHGNYPVQGHDLLLLLIFPFSVEEGCFLFGILKKKQVVAVLFSAANLIPPTELAYHLH